MVADHVEEAKEAAVGIELDRGLLGLVAAGYEVFAINPLSVDRYRDRHSTSGAKSDSGAPRCSSTSSAPIVTTTARSQATRNWAEAIKLLARTHQSFVRQRQRHVSRVEVISLEGSMFSAQGVFTLGSGSRTKGEARRWIERQLARGTNDGYRSVMVTKPSAGNRQAGYSLLQPDRGRPFTPDDPSARSSFTSYQRRWERISGGKAP